MSYTYPEALAALESIANEYIKVMRPNQNARVNLICDAYASTASVTWDYYGIRITMPVRPASSRMTQTEFENWVSFLLHELGHPTHTDQTVWREAVRLGLSRMVNALEDVRMERAVIASGIVPNAQAVLSRLIARKVVEARCTDWKPNSRKDFAWTICVLGRAANGYAINPDVLSWIMGQIKSGSTVSTVLGWALPDLDTCTSTQDCLNLATRIMKALASPQGEAGEEGEEGEGQPGKTSGEGAQGEGEPNEGEGEEGEGEEGQGEGQGEGEGEGQPGKGEGEGEREGEGDQEGEGGEGGKGGRGHGDGTIDSDESPVTNENELTERELAPEGENLPAGTGAAQDEKRVIDILRSGILKQEPREARERRMTANAVKLKDAAAQASKQRTLLARALRANETEDREGGRRSGRLDGKALVRAMTGASNVFSRKQSSEGFDTDVAVLLDASGSMAGTNMEAALQAGLVISQAAASVGAPCTVEIFNDTGYSRAGKVASKQTPNPADYGALVNRAEGGTPLSAHMARAAVHQATRAGHKRRVLFIITDGGCDYGPRTVKKMAGYLEQTYGTILAHVSIGTPLTGAFKAEVCVPYGTPLAQVGLDHFVKVLQAL